MTSPFAPKINVVAERYRFRQRAQLPHESVDNYIAALRKLASRCEFGMCEDEMLRDQLVEKTNSSKIRTILLTESNVKLGKAINLARQCEKEMKEAKSVGRGDTHPDTHTCSEVKSKPVGGVGNKAEFKKVIKVRPRPNSNAKCYCCGSPQHLANSPECTARSKDCNSCGKKGHLSSVCRDVKPASRELSDPKMKEKSKSTIEEYMHLKNKKEVIQYVKELQSPSKMHLFVHVAIEETLERTDQARKDAGELLNELVNVKVITVASYNKGFKGILEFAEDMAIDIPLIWKYLAQIISPAISGGSMNWQNLVSVLEPIKAIGKSGHVLAEVIKAQVKEVGAAVVSRKWAASGLQLQQFLNPGEDVQEFIERWDLGFLQSGMNLEAMHTELKYLLEDGQPVKFITRNSGKGAPQNNPNYSLSTDKKLRKSKNAWKPRVGAASTKPELETQDVNKKFTGILNKLTPQNFQKLTNQALEMQINTEECLKGVIDLIFEKALSEPNFSVAYAHMCRMLSQIEVPMSDNPRQLVQFRKLLLNRCQREFKSESQDENLLKEKRKEIEKLPEKEREVEKELFELAVYAAKQRSLGNIKFIGELFKTKMLTEHIMHSCIMQLMKAADDESLECMSKLLSTIGKELDHDKARFRMDQYFTQMDKIIKSRKNKNQIRFQLQDVLELRANNWVPRREDNKPKTIDQIHQEAREEEVMKKVKAIQAQATRKASRGRNDRGLPPVEDGEWNAVAQRSGVRPQQVDPSKFKVTKPPVDDNVQLGCGGRPGSFGGWWRGANGGAKQSSSSQERPSSPTTNRFSALPDDRRLQHGGSLASSRDHDRDRYGRGSQTKRWSREKDGLQGCDRDRQAAVDQVWRIPASQEHVRDRVQAKVLEHLPAQPASEELSDPEMKKKSKSTIEEYMHLKDNREAIQCVKKLQSPSKMHLFVHVAIEETLERTEQTRKDVGELLNELVNVKLITIASYNKGFKNILEFAEDMAIDIPLIWKYLAQIISPAISGGSMNLQNLISLLEPIKGIRKSGHLLAEVLKAQVKEVGAAVVSEKWTESGLQLQQFLNPGEDAKEFIERRDLGFLQIVPPTSSSGMNLDRMQTELKYLLKDASNEDVFQWIDRHFSKQKTLENDFIRALTTAVCKSAIHGEGPASRGDSELFKQRVPLLWKYIDSKDNLELQALFAVQSLNNSLANPPGLLRLFFDVLYDEDVICEETFYSWRENSDPLESEGKGVALKSVTPFFTWLREAEADDDDEPEKQ